MFQGQRPGTAADKGVSAAAAAPAADLADLLACTSAIRRRGIRTSPPVPAGPAPAAAATTAVPSSSAGAAAICRASLPIGRDFGSSAAAAASRAGRRIAIVERMGSAAAGAYLTLVIARFMAPAAIHRARWPSPCLRKRVNFSFLFEGRHIFMDRAAGMRKGYSQHNETHPSVNIIFTVHPFSF